MCTFPQQHAVGKITPFLRNVHFFASGKCTFLPQHARSKITPFLRNVRFFAAKVSDECALFRRNTQQTKSHLSFGMCTFSPQNFPMNVYFSAATRSRQNHSFPSECALFRIRELHFLTATSKKQNHTFPSECALFRRQIFR